MDATDTLVAAVVQTSRQLQASYTRLHAELASAAQAGVQLRAALSRIVTARGRAEAAIAVDLKRAAAASAVHAIEAARLGCLLGAALEGASRGTASERRLAQRRASASSDLTSLLAMADGFQARCAAAWATHEADAAGAGAQAVMDAEARLAQLRVEAAALAPPDAQPGLAAGGGAGSTSAAAAPCAADDDDRDDETTLRDMLMALEAERSARNEEVMRLQRLLRAPAGLPPARHLLEPAPAARLPVARHGGLPAAAPMQAAVVEKAERAPARAPAAAPSGEARSVASAGMSSSTASWETRKRQRAAALASTPLA